MPHSSSLPLFFSIIVVLAIAGIIVPFLKRLGISNIIGYLACGLIIGPFGIGQFATTNEIVGSSIIGDITLVKKLGEFGVIFLMFMIGLKLSFKQLLHLKHFILGLGISQIIITSLIIIFIATLFDNSLKTAILVGTSLALSSTAVVMHILNEKHLINTRRGNISFSVLLMQDLAVIPILVFLSASVSDSSGNIWLVLFQSLSLAIIVVIAILLLSKLLLRPLLHYLSLANNPEWLTAITLFIVIFISTITEILGLSAALGAFLAGLLISETEYKHEIEVIIEPLKGILLGIFFLSIGMSIDLNTIFYSPHWLIASVIGIFILKVAIIFPLGIIFGISKKYAIETAILLAGCGEFAFLILSIAKFHHLLPEEDAQFFLLLTAFSMMLTPFTIKLVNPAIKLIDLCFNRASDLDNQDQDQDVSDHVIIAGFGRVGRILSGILEKQGIPFTAIDKNIHKVSTLSKKGYNIIYGNAKRIELWKKLNAKSANIAIITVGKINESIQIINFLKKEYPHLSIIIRTKDTSTIETLYDNGADHVVPETLESTLQITKILLQEKGMDNQEITEYLNKSRKLAILEHADM